VWTVDVVKWSKTCDGSVNVHGMCIDASSATEEYPVRVGPTHKHSSVASYVGENSESGNELCTLFFTFLRG
jgi:hypothetical protein